ncbi:MAG TPA: 3'-5' exonuclease [Ignavibacteriales bacterium]|nr:3'-5' exonuclease [Ignavibacteriales bacterium]
MQNAKLLNQPLNDIEFVIVDVETTNAKPSNQYIIDIALIKVVNFQQEDKFNTLVKPRVQIDPIISNITNITNSMVQNAPYFNEIRTYVKYFIGNSVLVGHNVAFDKRALDTEYKRYDDPPLTNLTLDTLKLSQKLFPNQPKRSLNTMCKLLNIEHKNRHRALGDTLATFELFNVLVKTAMENNNIKTLKELYKFLNVKFEQIHN